MDPKLLEWAENRARLIQALTNPRRVLILHALERCELSVGEIAAKIDTSLQNTSQHLRVMKERGIVESRREGQTIYYWICEPSVLEIIHKMMPDQ